MDPRHLADAELVWRYLQLPHSRATADLMVVFGTNDLRVATHAARLYHDGRAPLILATGGIAHQGDLLATPWPRPEAEVFAEEMMRCGVPAARILIEPRATNTGDNVRLARATIEARPGPAPRSALAFVKPFMARRALATWAVDWPEMPVTTASWESTFAEYCTPELTPARVLNVMLGDLQRLWVYASRGWQAPQCIPDDVRASFERLTAAGYHRHLLPAGDV